MFCGSEVFIICDACLVSIPLHMLRHLRLPRTDRFVVRAVFSASVLSAIADIVTTTCNLVYFPNKITHMYVIGMTVQIRVTCTPVVNSWTLLTICPGCSVTDSLQPDRRGTMHLPPLQKGRARFVDTDIIPDRSHPSQDVNRRSFSTAPKSS
jgi:hypothetical protein